MTDQAWAKKAVRALIQQCIRQQIAALERQLFNLRRHLPGIKND